MRDSSDDPFNGNTVESGKLRNVMGGMAGIAVGVDQEDTEKEEEKQENRRSQPGLPKHHQKKPDENEEEKDGNEGSLREKRGLIA
jgi:hypothetical protein